MSAGVLPDAAPVDAIAESWGEGGDPLMSTQVVAVVHVHRWGHGRSSPRPPDVLLSEEERLGLVQPPRWPTPLLCLDCGELWPGEPVEPVYGRGPS